ncbi:MAG: serine hydrolase [Clostridia bacterium]|nr:serine hydrolase [Clostridia bacterium]MBQ3270935.1 serine hydrolase [Clostridia bacterium]
MNFQAFVDDIQANRWNVYGVEVYENGALAARWGDTDGNTHEIYSATKTVLSVAFGIACDRGLIRPSDPLTRFLPEERLARMPRSRRAAYDRLTLHRLLTMSVMGFPFRPEGESWLDNAISFDIDPNAVGFNYSNLSSYLAGVALTLAIGEDLGRFIEREVFAPLRIDDYSYRRCPEGYFYGASGMKLTVNELSRIGLLLTGEGAFGGERILSREYVRAATSVQQMNREGGYGYFIWKYRDGFSINGKWKQKCYCLPSRGLVITYLSHIENGAHDLLDSMERNILGL